MALCPIRYGLALTALVAGILAVVTGGFLLLGGDPAVWPVGAFAMPIGLLLASSAGYAIFDASCGERRYVVLA